MSWKAIVSYTTSDVPIVAPTRSSRSSRTGTMATFGSMVVKG